MTRYAFSLRLVHWLIALIVFGLLAVGLVFWWFGYDALVERIGKPVTGVLYQYHKTFGILVLMLMALRVLLRTLLPSPPYDPPLGGLERAVGGGVQLLLYVLLIGLPIGGWLATASSGFPIQFFDLTLPGLVGKNKELGDTLFLFHGIGALVLFILVVVHIAAGLKHWRLKDGVMARISLP